MIRKHWLFLFLLVAVSVLIGAGCSSQQAQAPQSRPPVPVTTAVVAQQNLPVQLRAIGNVEALSNVQVKTMIGGELVDIHFQEGQDVRKGDVLFSIDPRPYQAALQQTQANLARDTAALKQAEANLVRDTATANNARAEGKRYQELWKQGIISQELYDQKKSSFEASDATLAADRAAIENSKAAMAADQASIENAKINLGYCTVRAPFDGRTGSLAAFKGQVLKANDTSILTINQVAPIYVSFAVPQQYLNDIKRYSATGKLQVEAAINNDAATAEHGLLTFIDNSVDPATGTIKLKGTFQNANRRLWPGQFVDVMLTLSDQPKAIVVPSAAVNNSQKGQFVYVVKSDNTVENRPVVVSRTVGNSSVIEKGVQAGEKVVTDGQLRLVPGAKVVEAKGSARMTDPPMGWNIATRQAASARQLGASFHNFANGYSFRLRAGTPALQPATSAYLLSELRVLRAFVVDFNQGASRS